MITSGTSATNLSFTSCRFYSDLSPTGAGGYASEDVRAMRLIGSGTTTLQDCEFDHLWSGPNLQGSGTTTVDGCTIHHIYADFINIDEAETVIITNCEMHTVIGWGSIIHPDVIQWNGGCSGNVTIKGNIFYPGVWGQRRPGYDPLPTAVYESVAKTLTLSTHANTTTYITATSGTFYLPDVTTVTGEEFIIQANASGATIAASGADTDVDGVLPKVLSASDGVAFRSTGTEWVTKEVGTRAGTNKRISGGTLQPYHNKRIGLYDTSGGDLTVTLPASPSTNDWYGVDVWADTGSTVTVYPNSGQTLSYFGTTPATLSISSLFSGKRFRWDGTKWLVLDMEVGNQGIFMGGSSYSFTGVDVEVAGNIILANQTWGFRFDGDASNLPDELFVHHNTILPWLASDRDGDGRIGANDGGILYSSEGSLETRGYNVQIADANIANAYPVVNGGGTLSHNIDIDFNFADIGTTTKYDAYLDGAGAYSPSTKAATVSAFALTSGDYVGAVAYWDFTNGVAKTPPAMTVESNDATISTGVAFTISMSQVIAKSTGNIELYNVTDATTVETIAATSGSVAVDGCDLNVTFAGSISAGKTYSVRIAADAITSRYSGAWSVIADDSISATGA